VVVKKSYRIWFFQKVVVTKRCGLDEGLPVSPEKIAFSRALLDVA
jgi:hypothetical protein